MRHLLVLVLLLIAPPAAAHVGAGAGETDILLRDGSDDVWVKAPWGYVSRVADDDWRWVCHEVFSGGSETLLPDLVLGPDGTLLGVLGVLDGVVDEGISLYRSTDGGCSWQPTTGLEDRVVVGAAFDPADPLVALAITADLDTGDGVPANGIHRSVDGGATWALVQEWDARLMRSVRFGPAGRAYAIAAQVDPAAAWLLRSDDAGQTWQELPVPTDGVEVVTIGSVSATHPTDPDVLWLNFDGSTKDAVFASEDGGQSFSAVSGIPDAFLDVTLRDPGGWLVGGARALHRSDDGVTWSSVAGAPQGWGGDEDDRGFWLAVNTLADDRAVVRIESDGSVTDVLPTLDLAGPLQCPADSDVAVVCEPLWDELYEVLERMRPRPSGGDDDDSAAPPDPGCADCGGGGTALLPLVLLPLWRRRQSR